MSKAVQDLEVDIESIKKSQMKEIWKLNRNSNRNLRSNPRR